MECNNNDEEEIKVIYTDLKTFLNSRINYSTSSTTVVEDESGAESSCTIKIAFLYGSWNNIKQSSSSSSSSSSSVATFTEIERIIRHLIHILIYKQGLICNAFGMIIQVDNDNNTDEESLAMFIGENNNDNNNNNNLIIPSPPSELPVIAISLQTHDKLILRYVPILSKDLLSFIFIKNKIHNNNNNDVNTDEYIFAYNRIIVSPVRTVLESLEIKYNIPINWDKFIDNSNNNNENSNDNETCIRIFIAGDRSSVGKSSVCLGIIGTLLTKYKYKPYELAYIKPATQSESIQLIQLYCEQYGIQCIPIGPLVYYRGFTRAYLAGETESSDILLQKCSNAVDRIARNKKIILIDGVGFPAVGSICNTSNANVAIACGYRIKQHKQQEEENNNNNNTIIYKRKPIGVVLVGSSGVGAAVDGYNLNSTYFNSYNVPVLGAIFNKLSTTGFYSLENCKLQVSTYFELNNKRKPFGFLPLFSYISGKNAMDYVDEYLNIFNKHVDVNAIIEAAKDVKLSLTQDDNDQITIDSTTGSLTKDQHNNYEHIDKRRKLLINDNNPKLSLRSREEIEGNAIRAGAAPSA